MNETFVQILTTRQLNQGQPNKLDYNTKLSLHNHSHKYISWCTRFLTKLEGSFLESLSHKKTDKITFLQTTFIFAKKNSRLLIKVVFHQRLSSIEGCLLWKVVFSQRLSSIKGCLPSKVFFHQRYSSAKGYLPINDLQMTITDS